MAIFKICKNNSGQFKAFFKVKNSILFISKDYKSHKDCIKAVLSVKENPSNYTNITTLEGFINDTFKTKRDKLVSSEALSARIDPELYLL